MKEQLISFETAKLAKEKGFDEVTDRFFNDFYPKGEENINGLRHSDGDNSGFTSLPTQSLLQKWLREVHQVHVFIGWRPNKKVWDSHAYKLTLGGPEYVRYMNLSKFAKMPTYKTYEEALEAGLQEALKILSPETS